MLEANHDRGAEQVNPDTDPIEGVPTSHRDNMLLDWGIETLKQSIPRLNDSLQRTATLATALLGGSLFFVKDDSCPPFFRMTSMFLILISLAGAFFGSLARSESVQLSDPNDIERFKTELAEHRQWWLRFASGFLWVGMFIAAIGALLKAVKLA